MIRSRAGDATISVARLTAATCTVGRVANCQILCMYLYLKHPLSASSGLGPNKMKQMLTCQSKRLLMIFLLNVLDHRNHKYDRFNKDDDP